MSNAVEIEKQLMEAQALFERMVKVGRIGKALTRNATARLSGAGPRPTSPAAAGTRRAA